MIKVILWDIDGTLLDFLKAEKEAIKKCFEICPRQALHAKTLGFEHPRTHERMFFNSELPEDFASLLKKWEEIV